MYYTICNAHTTLIFTPNQAMLCFPGSPSALAAVAAPQQVYLVEVFLAGLITFWSPFPTVSVLRIFHWMCVCVIESRRWGACGLCVFPQWCQLWRSVGDGEMCGRAECLGCTLSLSLCIVPYICYCLSGTHATSSSLTHSLILSLPYFKKKKRKKNKSRLLHNNWQLFGKSILSN